MQQNQWILDEVDRATKEGIRVDVSGVLYNRKTSARLSRVLEEGSYMLDYEGNMTGHIIALHVDPVGPSEQPSYKSVRCTKEGHKAGKKEAQ